MTAKSAERDVAAVILADLRRTRARLAGMMVQASSEPERTRYFCMVQGVDVAITSAVRARTALDARAAAESSS